MYFAASLLLEIMLQFVYIYTLGQTFIKTDLAVVDTFLALLIV
jgi:hypothetical protein